MIIAPVVIPTEAGIHACMDAGGRAASGTGRRGRRGGVLNLSRSLPVCIKPAEVKSLLSCPLCGHVFHKPLDSGLRRNDNGVTILSDSGFLTVRHITTQSGQGDFNPAQPLGVCVQFMFNTPLAGLEVLEMFQHEIFSVVSLP